MSTEKIELWDILDENGNKTGRFHERGKPMMPGDYHLIVHVWKYNAKREWLINKRAIRYGSEDKYGIDGKWETTGGCAVAGEDSRSAAIREVKEELGIDLDSKNGTLFTSIARNWEDGHTNFVDVWVFEYNEPIEKVKPYKCEVSDAMWASTAKIRELMLSGTFLSERFYPYFDEMIKEYCGRAATN